MESYGKHKYYTGEENKPMEEPWRKINQDVLAEAIQQSSEKTREEIAENLRLIL